MTPRALWRGLLDGRWSIIDRYDLDGRRFLVARKNDPIMTKSRALTAREREIVAHAATGQSNKQIAYDVGLSVGAVSGYVSIALRKMGLRSRAELVVVASPSKLAMAGVRIIDQGAAHAHKTIKDRSK